jgi:hypothetical protein
MDRQLSFDDAQILGLPFVCMERSLSPTKIAGGEVKHHCLASEILCLMLTTNSDPNAAI